MCGFAGVLRIAGPALAVDEQRARVERMGATLVHRGPDDHGVWLDAEAGIALAHRRLSILDRSENGHQPMLSRSGRRVLAYNGEVYNFRELRRELEAHGVGFRGTSDTEVLLCALEHWGVRGAVERVNGMFAFALWDREKRELYLARDRMGKKPLYYGWAGDDLVFGSELKALRAHPRFDREIDRGALTMFLRYRYVPTPFTIYRDAAKLPAASLATVGAAADGSTARPVLRAESFWSAEEIAVRGEREPFEGGDEAATDALDTLLRDSISRRLIADVPVGAFLSGGIDSTTVVALAQALSTKPVKTYSIGFDFNRGEAKHAGAVARHLGTDHTEILVGGEETLEVVDLMPKMFDEPFADTSQILVAIICRKARRHVTVALSGDGGDELFFGYGRYERCRKLWALERHIPATFRRALARGVRAAARGEPGEGKLHSAAVDLDATTGTAAYLNRVSCWTDPGSLVVDGFEPASITDRIVPDSVGQLEQRMMLLDIVTYLSDDILVKVDRASMATSLEVRAPLLDYRVVELALRLPFSMKSRNGATKWILRRVLERYVPPAMTERPKEGFGAPIRRWLHGALRERGEELLEPGRLEREGYLRPEKIRTMWEENTAGRRKWYNHLWPVLMFQAWLEQEATK